MQITRIKDAKPYEAAKHYGMEALRLQGLEASDLQSFSCNLSYFQPGGGAERSRSANEKVYVVLEGEITIITDTSEETLGALDSCVIGVNEFRVVENRSNSVCKMLVIISKNMEA
jgi:mannose-6-phosphate isomerase-like protein (cupin superfamily)